VGSARRRRLPVELAAIAIAVALAGCATAPSGGPPRRATGEGTQVQAYVQPLPPPAPAPSWTSSEVVLGFLHASASYAFDPGAAEQYLAPKLRKAWHPDSGPVAVVGNPTSIISVPYRSQIPGPAPHGQQLEVVKFTGQQLATLSQTGRYQYAPGQNVEYEFIVARTDGVWRIQELPQGQAGLLLTQSDFQAVYQARNLFFYAQPAGVLVPDPVYAPLQSSNSALNTDLATGLVSGLLKGQGDWLSGATVSAFPPGSRLIKQVTIRGRIAQVDLGGAAAHATRLQVQLMEAQLRATLGDGSYSAPLANEVQLYINNKLQYSDAETAGADLVPPVATGPVSILTGAGTVGQLPANPLPDSVPTVKVGPVQVGQVQITAIADTPPHGRAPQQLAVATQDGKGCAVQLKVAGQPQYRSYALTTSGGECTSLSWDNNGDLWAAAGDTVWLLRSQDPQPTEVGVAALAAIGQSGSRILSLQMAPDGVRAALLVHTKDGNRLLLAAVRFDRNAVALGTPITIGAGGADPVAISWFDPYHLAVLAGGTIFEVPLTGGASVQSPGSSQSLATAPSGAETLTTDGSELVAGTADGHIFASSPASPLWSLVTTGWDPVYPG
jgi:hypothetical protein